MFGHEVEHRQVGTVDSSQELFNCTLATVLSPDLRASFPVCAARGPGPTAESEYSPTLVARPPRTIGSDHSLTDCSQTGLGSRAMMSGRRGVRPAPIPDDHFGLRVAPMYARSRSPR